jgi:hypothetical protein
MLPAQLLNSIETKEVQLAEVMRETHGLSIKGLLEAVAIEVGLQQCDANVHGVTSTLG